ncbi:MAG: hypothetical protein H0V05_13080, partial [Euzebyaceae bacterium]|nr:hypothetical protein [Euzebyaceae bacterium]
MHTGIADRLTATAPPALDGLPARFAAWFLAAALIAALLPPAPASAQACG